MNPQTLMMVSQLLSVFQNFTNVSMQSEIPDSQKEALANELKAAVVSIIGGENKIPEYISDGCFNCVAELAVFLISLSTAKPA